MENDGYEAFHI